MDITATDIRLTILLIKTCSLFTSAWKAKKSARETGIPSSTFLRELTDGLILFVSIYEIVASISPDRLANFRCDSGNCLRTTCRRLPRSLLILPIPHRN